MAYTTEKETNGQHIFVKSRVTIRSDPNIIFTRKITWCTTRNSLEIISKMQSQYCTLICLHKNER